MKDDVKRKIIFVIAVMVFLMGVVGIFKRKDPIDKVIGNVYISDGKNETAISGHKVSVDWNGKKSERDYPKINDEADRLCKLNTSPESGGNMKISFSKKYCGDALYSIYDSDFNEVSTDQTSLNIPGNIGSVYYISVLVTWGTENENVSMIYYFSVNT